MNQLSLNLVAITIFTLVMMTLLGPFVHLSPVVPALTVVTVMGLATLDTLGWQGRGSTLLLDGLAQFSPEHRDRVLHHEAGHFLVAYLLNIPVTGYTLTAWGALRQGQPGRGGVSFDGGELDAELAKGSLSNQLLDRYSTVWMAGMAAETLTYGNAEGATDDRQKLYQVWGQLNHSSTEITLKERWATLQAKTLIETHQGAYDALVAVMTQRGTVNECREAIQQAIPPNS